MKEIGAYEAKTHFSELLERVVRGEVITITRHGLPVAVLSPPPSVGMSRQQAAAGIRKLREQLAARGVSVTSAEIRDWTHGGHRY